MVNKRLSRLKTYITSNDLFGKPVRLSFDHNSYTYNTLIGGILTLIVRGICLFYLLVLLFHMKNGSNDIFVMFEQPHNIEDILDFKQINIIPYVMFLDEHYDHKGVDMDTFNKYLDVYWAVYEYD